MGAVKYQSITVFLRCGTGEGLFGSLLDQVHAALFRSHLLCLPWSICLLLSGTQGSWLSTTPKGMSFIRLWGINVWFSCGDDSSRFLHMFVSSHIFRDEFSQDMICYLYGGGFVLSPYCLLVRGGCQGTLILLGKIS